MIPRVQEKRGDGFAGISAFELVRSKRRGMCDLQSEFLAVLKASARDESDYASLMKCLAVVA